MELIGNITLNISLIIYFVHFFPQTVHNQLKHTTADISLWTHSLMIMANTLDLVYAIGFNMQWQYILVDVVLLTFLTIQQLQILADRKSKKIIIHTFGILFFIFVVILLGLTESFSKDLLLFLGSVSVIVYNIYWLPQIYKNYSRKHAQGFSIIYLFLSVFTSSCDIISGITLGWPLPSIVGSVCLLTLISVQIFQYFYYSGEKVILNSEKYVY